MSASVPFACIRERPGATATLCARFPDKSECIFEDADHAVAHYTDTPRLRVCSACATVYRVRKERDGAEADPGVAVRGLGGSQ